LQVSVFITIKFISMRTFDVDLLPIITFVFFLIISIFSGDKNKSAKTTESKQQTL
jgi:hypothetical protein